MDLHVRASFFEHHGAKVTSVFKDRSMTPRPPFPMLRELIQDHSFLEARAPQLWNIQLWEKRVPEN